MIAQAVNLMNILKGPKQFIIPVYQRTLSQNAIPLRKLKCVEKITSFHEAHLLTYLKLSSIKTGLIINFHTGVLNQVLKDSSYNSVSPCRCGYGLSRLGLSINMRFSEIDDPKGLWKNVMNLGRWGNGDVEVGVSSAGQLEDVMCLVVESFERNLDNGGQ